MGLFKKKLSDEELIKQNIANQQAEIEEKEAAKNKKGDDLGDSKLGIEITKLKAQVEGLNEQRQAVNEKFGRISEEIGEIRGMVMDTNKSVGNIEASATKAIDLVESVKPDQLMLEVRKQDSKVEALKANIESNESLMRDMMKEVKEMRKRMDFYKGVEQVAKMNEEIKKELIDIKKSEGTIERHSNKVETIFLEVEKKFTEFDKYGDVAKDLQRSFQKLQGDVDKLRIKAEDKADKKELVKLMNKFNDFEKHTTNIINLMDERSKSSTEQLKKSLEKITSEAKKKVDTAIKQLGVNPDVVPVEKEKKEKRPWRGLFGKKQEEAESKPEEEPSEKPEEKAVESKQEKAEPAKEEQPPEEEPAEIPEEEKPVEEAPESTSVQQEQQQEMTAQQEPQQQQPPSKKAILSNLALQLEQGIQSKDMEKAVAAYNSLKADYLENPQVPYDERKELYKYLLKAYKKLAKLERTLRE